MKTRVLMAMVAAFAAALVSSNSSAQTYGCGVNPAPCCSVHPTEGCSDPTCCAIVCAMDPFCCTNNWDSICVGEANSNCAACGAAGNNQCGNTTAPCCAAHDTPSCSDPGCCAIVCAMDPFCCNNLWDGICADEAIANCATCGAASTSCSNGAGACCTAHPTPYCNNPACCNIVCSVDPFCCNNQWDGICAGEALVVCPACSSTAPSNDECANAIAIGSSVTLFNTTRATTSALPWDCGGAFFAYDVWFAYTHAPTCITQVTFSTCFAADFDTTMAAYAGSCGGTPIACNDDSPDCGVRSTISFLATPGTTYYIRVGGANTHVGIGVLTTTVDPCPSCGTANHTCCEASIQPYCNDASCCAAVCSHDPYCCNVAWDSYCVTETHFYCTVCAPPCPADIDGNHQVDGADLGLLLGSWGTATHDLDGDGVVSGSDLGLVLGAWGPCPN